MTLLVFPCMHPALLSAPAPEGALFLDPGLAPGQGRYRPADLPLDEKTLKAMLKEFLNFGEQFREPKELSYFLSGRVEDFYSGTSQALASDLSSRLAGGPAGPDPALSQAQATLALAYLLEERLAEAEAIDRGVRAKWGNFGQALGLTEEETRERAELALDEAMAASPATDVGPDPFPWKLTLAAMLAFLPEDGRLWCVSPEAVQAWAEADLAFAPAQGLPAGAREVRAEGFRLLGLTRCPAGRPWLARTVRAAAPGPEAAA